MGILAALAEGKTGPADHIESKSRSHECCCRKTKPCTNGEPAGRLNPECTREFGGKIGERRRFAKFLEYQASRAGTPGKNAMVF
jgi:hypothetical protein